MVLPAALCRGFPATASLLGALNGLQMVRKRLLGTVRGPVSSALWGRIYNRMVDADPEWAWLPSSLLEKSAAYGWEGRAGKREMSPSCGTFHPGWS